jgi:hypothetical protein
MMVKAEDMDRARRYLGRHLVSEWEDVVLAAEFATVREQTIDRMREAICAAVENVLVGMMGGGR